jgi:microsomal epoxide hydrolase
MTPIPFTLNIPEADIEDLRTRLARTRLPDQAPGAPWAYGTDLDYMRDLIRWWRDHFDWRAQRADEWFAIQGAAARTTCISFESRKGPDPMPLLLMHGWPGSVFEFIEIVPRLSDPARFGGDPRDAFTVIAPSLPGFGLSFRPGQPRFSIEQIADCLHDLMRNVLGYERFGAQGGDYGAFTATPWVWHIPSYHPLNFLVVG